MRLSADNGRRGGGSIVVFTERVYCDVKAGGTRKRTQRAGSFLLLHAAEPVGARPPKQGGVR
jgi:hypothetical protein